MSRALHGSLPNLISPAGPHRWLKCGSLLSGLTLSAVVAICRPLFSGPSSREILYSATDDFGRGNGRRLSPKSFVCRWTPTSRYARTAPAVVRARYSRKSFPRGTRFAVVRHFNPDLDQFQVVRRQPSPVSSGVPRSHRPVPLVVGGWFPPCQDARSENGTFRH